MEYAYQPLLEDFTAACREILGGSLTGVYLHGSLAMGCFCPKTSDIDLLVALEGGISDEQKRRLMDCIVALNQRAPAKGLEISFVKRQVCKPFVYPTPFELHFSTAHLPWYRSDPEGYIRGMNGADKDLAAHITVLHRYGVRLWGAQIGEVFGPVPRADYADSIWQDVAAAQEEIVENGVYVTLNLCRVLAALRDGLVLSKAQGAAWALENLEEPYRTLAAQAGECYRTGRAMQPQPGQARQFAAAMLEKIGAERARCGLAE